MEPENQATLLPFLQRVRAEAPGKDVWLYTGYRLEELQQSPLLALVDVIVDGPFIEEEKDISLAFRGSRNQRIVDMKKWRSSNAENRRTENPACFGAEAGGI